MEKALMVNLETIKDVDLGILNLYCYKILIVIYIYIEFISGKIRINILDNGKIIK
jgi:hypothetical protein